ncbi:carboxypeptidase-like regulatory domain-containing protein [Rubinisphaera sp.]|uniref:carboxypeptidase-like regulatory domain-containing protein n=1 Tax=Rubinisphaera sp. TaxID=2024857 RepID=UPI0025EE9A0E|nr:carboxypeptidase-like regulatory domain-containing protein [Rubinisphaera sp.]|tara:strand:- start:725 stop:1156 length:432 start_codon:yes stop_codon:yes gene_type:complete
MPSSYYFCLTLAIQALLIAGCGDSGPDLGPTGTLRGTVMFESTPVTEGSVHLSHLQEGHGGVAQIDGSGAYAIDSYRGLPVGTYQVTVIPPMVEVDAGPNSPKSESPKDMKNIPQKYRDPSTSGLTVEITAGENTFEINMSGK